MTPGQMAGPGLAVLTLLAGCFHVDPPDGLYACDPGGCPPGLSCATDHLCRRHDDPVDLSFEDCSTVYVSALHGDNGQSGCEQHPLRDLSVALVRAAGREIHVCKGRYAENTLQLFGATVRGGYDCQTWQRTASYGYPAFDAVNETVIVNAANTPVLAVSGGVTTLEGLTIRAQLATGEPAISKTVDVGHGQTSISDCDLAGVDTVASLDDRSTALFIHDDAAVDVAHDRVAGGGGSPSVGISVDDSSKGRVHIHDNTIDGGTGTSTYLGSAGIVVTGNALLEATGTAIERNLVRGGAGNHGVAYGMYASVGIEVANGGSADLIDNVIDGGLGENQNSSVGIHRAGGSGALRVLDNRISSGHTKNAQFPLYGVAISGIGPVEVTNNMIFATADGGNGGARGIGAFQTAESLVIRHNTMFIDSNDNGGAIALERDARRAVIENNLLTGSAGGSAAALLAEDCPDQATVRSMRNNLSVALAFLHYGPDAGHLADGEATSCPPDQTWARTDDGEAELASRCASNGSVACTRQGGALVSGNVTLSNRCGPDVGCIVRSTCTAPAGCARDLFEPGELGDEPTLLMSGWKLRTGIPCAVAQSSLDLSQSVPLDLFGHPRAHMPTMGAQEIDPSFMACLP